MPINGANLIFVTYPAIFSTMAFPNFWTLFFFVTMIFIGIDSQFGLVEVTNQYIEDMNIKFCGEILKGPKARLFGCGLTALLGLILTTRGGYYLFKLLDNYNLNIPCALTNMANIYIFTKLADVDSLYEKLCQKTGEKINVRNIWFMKNVSIWVYCFMFVLGVYD